LRSLNPKVRDAVFDLRQNLTDIRIYAQAFESSETGAEQIINCKLAKKALNHARKHILAASEYNIFGPVDVAHLSAKIEQIMDELK